MKRYGFTLTEILIALAIIGVVSALTLPGLMTNYQEKTFVTQLQTVYNLLSNAAAQLKTDEQVDSLAESSLSSDSGPSAFLQNYFNLTKLCSTNTSEKTIIDPSCNPLFDPSCAEGSKELVTTNDTSCLVSQYRSLDKSEKAAPQLANYSACAVLSTGATLCLGPNTGIGSFVIVDVNGIEAPNIAGRDFFSFYLLPNGKIAENNTGDITIADQCETGAANNGGTAKGCFSRIVKDGWKMNY